MASEAGWKEANGDKCQRVATKPPYSCSGSLYPAVNKCGGQGKCSSENAKAGKLTDHLAVHPVECAGGCAIRNGIGAIQAKSRYAVTCKASTLRLDGFRFRFA